MQGGCPKRQPHATVNASNFQEEQHHQGGLDPTVVSLGAIGSLKRQSGIHVERKSLCIHSQLTSPSSSEVASMIEGVIRHCTEMEVDCQYVDSHVQSTVAFAFCRLLGF
jgi:Tn3 transposase DDE domain-containing protein